MIINHKGTKTLKTERLILKAVEEKDYKSLYENLFGDKEACEICKWKYWETYEEFKKEQTIIKDKNYYNWIIYLKDKTPVGMIGVHTQDDKNYSCIIGYQIHPKYQNNGYCTEALKEVARFLIKEVGYYRLVCEYEDNNIASKRVMEKAGFIYEGTNRRSVYKNNRFKDIHVYSLIKEDISI